MDKFTITRRIEIDAAHRVPTHGSKCFNLHGHRYVVEATVEAERLIPEGEQQAMVLDFGFLKEIMVQEIHDPCDHGTIVWREDKTLISMLFGCNLPPEEFNAVTDVGHGGLSFEGVANFKVLVTDFIPTAEELAHYWFERMRSRVHERSNGVGTLKQVIVHETPNCQAVYGI